MISEFKQGDVVTYPNSSIFYQVVRNVPEDEAVICKLMHHRKPIPLKMLTNGLIRTSIH